MELQSFYDERRYSYVDNPQPDKEKFPLYYEAQRKEYLLDEGEMLFIPAGWFQYILWDDPGSNGVCTSVKFRYNNYTFTDTKKNEERPKMGNCSFSFDPHQILTKPLQVLRYKSKQKPFPSEKLGRLYGDLLSGEFLKYDEIIETKNPEYFVMHSDLPVLDKYAPKYTTKDFYDSSFLMNFGYTYSHMFYDEKDTWLCQMGGKARVILFPYSDKDKLYLINPYPTQFVETVYETMTSDMFIKRNFNCFEPKYFTQELLHESFDKEYEEYRLYLLDKDCSPIGKPQYAQFKVVEANGKVYDEPSQLPFNMIWFVTPGTIHIRKYSWDVDAGEFFIFPNSFLYSFYIDKAKTIYALK